MTMDEYETIRLVDLEKCTHEQCAKQMGICLLYTSNRCNVQTRGLINSVHDGRRYRRCAAFPTFLGSQRTVGVLGPAKDRLHLGHIQCRRKSIIPEGGILHPSFLHDAVLQHGITKAHLRCV